MTTCSTTKAFVNCEKLQQHMRFLLAKGGLYKAYNDNLLYHGCVPLNEDGSLKEVEVFGKMYKGRELYDTLDSYVRTSWRRRRPIWRRRIRIIPILKMRKSLTASWKSSGWIPGTDIL